MSKLFLSIVIFYLSCFIPVWAKDSNNLSELEKLDELTRQAYKKKNCTEAESHFNKTLETRMKIFGQTYEDILSGYEKIARCWRKKGNMKRSLVVYHKLKDLCDVVFYDNYYVLAAIHEILGEVYLEDEQYKVALAMYDQALDYKIEQYGFEHLETAQTYEDIAAVYEEMISEQDMASKQDAVRMYLKALMVYRKKLAESDYRTVRVLGRINAVQPENKMVMQLLEKIAMEEKRIKEVRNKIRNNRKNRRR